MLRVHLRLTAPRRRGKAGRPLVEYESWIVAGKKVNMLTCPPPVLMLASSYLAINHVGNVFLAPGEPLWRRGLSVWVTSRVRLTSNLSFFFPFSEVHVAVPCSGIELDTTS